jgi:hypothetical protein
LSREPLAVGRHAARMTFAASAARSRTPAKLYVYDTLIERLAQDLEDMTAALGPFIHEEHAMVR